MTEWEKDPDSTLDYIFDWTDWLLVGDKIDSAEIIINPSTHSAALTNVQTTWTDNRVILWLTAGRMNIKYSVTCRINTKDGRTEDNTKIVKITEK